MCLGPSEFGAWVVVSRTIVIEDSCPPLIIIVAENSSIIYAVSIALKSEGSMEKGGIRVSSYINELAAVIKCCGFEKSTEVC